MNRGLKHNYRVTVYEDRVIRNKAKRARISVSAYVRKAALEKEIIVIDGLREMMPEHHAIGNNLNQQMINTKLDFHQDTGRQYVHIVQSFAVDDKLNSKIAHEIGQRLLESFDGFQGVVCTHTDRSQLHNHIVLNSVNWKTGRKWQSSKNDLHRLHELSDSQK